ncbi:uncharacterized protein LOC130555786 [Triplophysa rosa]|uniref:uncharacterized protein LOC130555786 n=1 Tax=Triplophysa rosa TaxID=992332 RepID=UPI002545CFBD|nr:uncharacterized protein LOC130555786 [Triplophysa rosa]
MKTSQTWILHLNLCIVLTSLTHADSDSSVQTIQHHVFRTVYEGDTVTLHCNTTPHDEDITWKMNNSVIFSYDSFHNRNMTKFTSDRMCISPAAPTELKINQIQTSDAGNYSCHNTETAMRWILTVTENTPEESLEQALLYILISGAGVIMVCLMIGFIICIHRRRKNNRDAGQRSPAPASRRTPARRLVQCRSEVKSNDPRNYSIYENVSNIK